MKKGLNFVVVIAVAMLIAMPMVAQTTTTVNTSKTSTRDGVTESIYTSTTNTSGNGWYQASTVINSAGSIAVPIFTTIHTNRTNERIAIDTNRTQERINNRQLDSMDRQTASYERIALEQEKTRREEMAAQERMSKDANRTQATIAAMGNPQVTGTTMITDRAGNTNIIIFRRPTDGSN